MKTQQHRPANLLVILSDEHRKDAMGCMGHATVKTPWLDQLAARGTLFSNAYTPSPMCVPTRAALACGNYVHRIRHWDSATPYDGKTPSWMAHLRDRGVDVTSIGKLHFRSPLDDNGFTEELLPMHVTDGVGWAIGLLREQPPPYNEASELARDVGIGSSSYSDYDLDITAAAEQWLHDRASSDSPWATVVSLVSPHYPLTCPERHYTQYNPHDMPLPIGYGTNTTPQHTELQNLARFFAYDKHFDEQKTREAIAAYYGLTSFMDDCTGRVLTALQQSGQADNTVVIYISDHGEMLGDQGFWTKQLMYEQSAGIPMIVAGPGIPASQTISTGTSLLDIAATAIDVTGVQHTDHSKALPGISLRRLANEANDPDRTIFSEYHDGGSTTAMFMVRWQHWKYIHYAGQQPQLFNLQSDPNELTDLADHKTSHSSIQNALDEGERRLLDICDPQRVNRQCFADQQQRIEQLGGVQACKDAYVFNHTPTPREQTKRQNPTPG